MMTGRSDQEIVDRISRRRAHMLPVLGIRFGTLERRALDYG